MNISQIKNLCQIAKREELAEVLLNDGVGYFKELRTVHDEKPKDPRKMSHLLAVFKRTFAVICESNEKCQHLLVKIFEVTVFQEEITKYLSHLTTLKKVVRDSHYDGLQGLYYYFQNLDKVARYDNSEVGFYLKDAFPAFELAKIRLLEDKCSYIVYEPAPRECQKPVADGILRIEDSGDENSGNEAESRASSKKSVAEQGPALLGDYRTMSIFPSYDDIHRDNNPFIRVNLTENSYKNIDHYLDTQFRLLREDFVRPLHDSVTKYIKLLKDSPEKVDNDPDIMVYHDVEFSGSEMVARGLVFTVRFNIERLGKINWTETSRLLPGSLLCLSCDTFKTMFFATVAERKPEEVIQGIIGVRIESNSFDFYSLLGNDMFVAIESSGYFEAYRHSLIALQQFNSAYSFPLKRYVVDVAKDVRKPAYLRDDVHFDFSGLAYPIDRKKLYQEDEGHGFRLTRSLSLKSVPLFKKSAFPWDLMDLDSSQFEAFHASLTREFAVIQGPPGTGKSYIGLRIIQALIRNRVHWSKSDNEEAKTCPILILSYKNHALDQFLEGVLNFTHDIVRVGGRSESKRLGKIMLNEKRKDFDYESLPKADRRQRYMFMKSLKETITDIGEKGAIVKEVKGGVRILGRELVKYFARTEHGVQIKSLADQSADDVFKSGIVNWLNFNKRMDHDENLVAVLEHAKSVHEGLKQAEAEYVASKEAAAALRLLNMNEYGDTWGENGDELAETMSEVSEFDIEKLEERTSKGTNLRGQMLMAMRVMDPDEYAREDSFKVDEIKLFKKLASDDKLAEMAQNANLPKELIKKVKLIKFLKTLFDRTSEAEIMSDEEAGRVDDLRKLTIENKYRMLNYWVHKFLDDKKIEIDSLSKQITLIHEKLETFAAKRDFMICKSCQVIGMTITGAAKYRQLVELLAPKIVIIEEAAEILEPYLISSLTHKTEHVILIGDHQQLRPIAGVHELSVKYNLEISLFERMVKNGMAYHQLINQHRMRPAISRLLVPHIYKKLNNHESVKKRPNILNFKKKNVFFFEHKNPENRYMGHSFCNKYESEFVVELVRYFLLSGVKPESITVLVTYNGQLTMIRKDMLYKYRSELQGRRKFNERKEPLPIEPILKVASVDSYQGEENDIVIISFVRSNAKESIGFLETSNRVCVALSRARNGLFCVGDFELFAKKSDLWKGIIGTLREHDSIGTELEVGCECRPFTITGPESLREVNAAIKQKHCYCSERAQAY